VFPCLWLLFIFSFYNETNGTWSSLTVYQYSAGGFGNICWMAGPTIMAENSSESLYYIHHQRD